MQKKGREKQNKKATCPSVKIVLWKNFNHLTLWRQISLTEYFNVVFACFVDFLAFARRYLLHVF